MAFGLLFGISDRPLLPVTRDGMLVALAGAVFLLVTSVAQDWWRRRRTPAVSGN